MSNIPAGEFTSFKHIKTRKVFVIEVEFPEEKGREVLEYLGMPIGGESKPVAVALLDKSIVTKPETNCDSEGDKLRVRAVLLCKDWQFQDFLHINNFDVERGEEYTKKEIYKHCDIKSRSELTHNIDAQNRFKELLIKFDTWKLENRYADNLERV